MVNLLHGFQQFQIQVALAATLFGASYLKLLYVFSVAGKHEQRMNADSP